MELHMYEEMKRVREREGERYMYIHMYTVQHIRVQYIFILI